MGTTPTATTTTASPTAPMAATTTASPTTPTGTTTTASLTAPTAVTLMANPTPRTSPLPTTSDQCMGMAASPTASLMADTEVQYLLGSFNICDKMNYLFL